MKRYLPINVSIEDADCLVVGGGRVALRKVRSLLACGGRVRVVSVDVCDELAALEGVAVERRAVEVSDVEGARIVFAATSDNEVNRSVYDAARARGVWVNVVDVPELCDFIVPATVKRGPLSISISTAGAAPALARELRKELEARFSERFGEYVALLGELRGEVMARVADPERRRAIFEKLAAKEAWRLFDAEGPEGLRETMRDLWER